MSCLKQSTQADTGLPGADRAYNAFEAMQPRFPEQTPAEARNGRRVKDAAVPPQGVYLPNDNVLTPQMRSPEYVQMSNAAAITLGIMAGKMHRCGCTRCLNLLLTYPEGCRANCAYCGLARHREADRDYADRNFIRVDWPAVPTQQVVDIVTRDGEDVGTEVLEPRDVRALHGRRVRQDRHGDRGRVDLRGPALEHGDRVGVRIRVRDHRDAHAVERTALAVAGDDVHHLLHRHRGPVHADEVAVGVIALGLAVPRESAVGTVRAAALRVGEQQVQAARAAAAVHLARHDAERDRRGVRHLHVLGRAHLRRQDVVVRQVHALRRHGRLLDAPAVARLGGRLPRHARLHGRVGIERKVRSRQPGGRFAALLDATHRANSFGNCRAVRRRRCGSMPWAQRRA